MESLSGKLFARAAFPAQKYGYIERRDSIELFEHIIHLAARRDHSGVHVRLPSPSTILIGRVSAQKPPPGTTVREFPRVFRGETSGTMRTAPRR